MGCGNRQNRKTTALARLFFGRQRKDEADLRACRIRRRNMTLAHEINFQPLEILSMYLWQDL